MSRFEAAMFTLDEAIRDAVENPETAVEYNRSLLAHLTLGSFYNGTDKPFECYTTGFTSNGQLEIKVVLTNKETCKKLLIRCWIPIDDFIVDKQI